MESSSMMKSTPAPKDNNIPINPYWVGGHFLDYCAKQGWMSMQREGRSTRYYCTPAGVEALKQFGIDIRRPEEGKTKDQPRRSTK
jgi:hypothetical protein